ncbi:hypothetical protein [Corallococcus macrosporus]|nr:hypothetical protein [Corallococcus macrosporus]
MQTTKQTSPMNPDTLNDTVIGIGVLAPVALLPAPVLLPGLPAGGRWPGL